MQRQTFLLAILASCASAWVPSSSSSRSMRRSHAPMFMSGSLHGENSCFLPLKQLDQDYYAPRIVQIAGAYPGLTRAEYEAVSSDPPAEPGQWTYGFSDPEGPPVGTVAMDGSNAVAVCEDPVAIIGDHFTMKLPLPEVLTDPVDLVLLVDRAAKTFAERKFLVLEVPGKGIDIGAFSRKDELPGGAEILGQVVLCQVPWLPCMKPTKTGFLEADEYF
uniref:Rubisco accumulation factor 1 C-terminal domain-containing protein n=1 Tax=Craspedostauros australis TaxID=1486917 RepID=A0A7R9ZQZ4_9STRA|mmetsp:Transcript_6446/g.17552  ORF Transcript_6446/g.17552 Transcript_6446/m.17552 type:complete len:218 (+) Transcript_6446:220-873(+)